MVAIVGSLTPEQIQQAQQNAQTIANSATKTISSNQFVFFAAFDGTNNDKTKLPPGEQSTNVGQLSDQAELAAKNNTNIVAKYYSGPGTKTRNP